MFTVALVGADGAGKTTVGRFLEHSGPLPARYVYMGANPASATHMLPTTRLTLGIKRALGLEVHQGGPPGSAPVQERGGPARVLARSVKRSLRLALTISEDCYHQLVAWRYRRRGYVVLFDRHQLADFWAHAIETGGGPRPLSKRLYALFLQHVVPSPQLVILLDAPARVLFERKREGTLELLERRRDEYLRFGRTLEHFQVVDAGRPAAEVAHQVAGCIADFQRERRG